MATESIGQVVRSDDKMTESPIHSARRTETDLPPPVNKCDINFADPKAVATQLNTIKETIVATVPVEQIYLFGSYAQGEPDADSDLDIFVVVPDDTGREIDITIDLRKAIRSKKSLPVDLLVSSLSRFRERISSPTLEREIYEQGQLIYG
jgi:predicted nucleotidyltransferase